MVNKIKDIKVKPCRILMLKKIHDTFSQALAISPTSTATLALRQKLLQLTLRKAVAALAAPRAPCGAAEKIGREEREGTHEPSQQELELDIPRVGVNFGYVKIAIENDHRNSEFSHWKWWFSIVMLVYQRVSKLSHFANWKDPPFSMGKSTISMVICQ